MTFATLADFQAHVAAIQQQPGYVAPAAFAVGIAHLAISNPLAPWTVSEGAAVLDTWYPTVNCSANYGTAAVLAQVCGHKAGSASYRLSLEQVEEALAAFAPFENDGKHHANMLALKAVRRVFTHPRQEPTSLPRVVVVSFIGDLQAKAIDVHDAYLRLHLLSHCLVKPHGQNLDGIFGLLNNVAWTDHGPCLADSVDCIRSIWRGLGFSAGVRSVDKFPRMTDYVVPQGVRIADGDRVRLGAHLAPGTTVMHEGFCNFNAGTLGKSMVEGRISAGVVVGDGSDIGGGASIMGTLSGGGKEVISIGKRCLLGANAGLGISLGDECTVESGLYVTAASKVTCLWDGQVRKAALLSGQGGLLYRRNSQTGAIEVLHNKTAVALNPALHA